MMVMPVTVTVTVVVVVVVRMSVIVAVLVVVAMTMPAGSVAAGLRLERTLDHQHFQAQLVHQAVEHVIVLVGQAPGLDLQRYVPVAQVIGRPSQQVTIRGFDGRKKLGSRPHLDHQRAIFAGEPLTVLERQTAFEQQPNLLPAVQLRSQARASPQLEDQRQRIRGAPSIAGFEHVFEHLHGRLHQNKK